MSLSIRKVKKERWVENWDMMDEQLENDEISAAEAGFMEGYLKDLEVIEEEE